MHDLDVSLIVSNLQTINANVNQLREDLNNRVDELKQKLDTHENTDREYWKKVDKRETQITLLKGLTFSSFGLWVWTYFKDQLGLK